MQYHGTVVSGFQNGRKFGFPTANLQMEKPPRLAKGSYAVRIEIDGKRHKGMLYVGTRPTLNLKKLTFEIHLLDFHQDIYGKALSFDIVEKIRDEQRFENTDALIAQLKKDRDVVRKILGNPRRRLARTSDIPAIMKIIAQASKRLAMQGIDQWQDGYPNEGSIRKDIATKQGHVFISNDEIVAYAAIVFDPDPYYSSIDGQWLSEQPYVVVHRIAVADSHTHQGIAKYILGTAEKMAHKKGISSFRIDTHFRNHHMRNLIRENGFTLCGIVQVRDGKRMAYEKISS